MERAESTAGECVDPAAVMRRLETLERLLELPGADMKTTLSHAMDLAARATGADKCDAFLYDPTRDSLVAVGTSHQPLSARQRQLGLDVLPVTNGGRVVHVYTTGRTFVSGRLDEDHEELPGVRHGLGIRSKLGVPLTVAGTRRGIIMLASQQRDFFTPEDVRFGEAIARWTATVAHRAELVEQISRNAAEQGRRAGAEELVTVVAHDLRNLIGPLDTLLYLLHGRAEREERSRDVADLQTAQRAVRRLRTLTSDILDVARIDRGLFHLAPEPVEIPDLVTEIARTLESPAHPIDVRVAAVRQLVVAADTARLRQCLENLITNAIQKSPTDAPVDVVIGSERRVDGEWARIEIVDQGPGVSGHMLPHIFERYATDQRAGGLGLGLYLAKQIAMLHGGDVTVDATPGRGARFLLALPCYPAAGDAPLGN